MALTDDPHSSTHGPVMSQLALAKHFGVTTMSIWRWRQDMPGFPRPMEIGGRLYWSVAAIEAWKATRVVKTARTPVSQGVRAHHKQAQAEKRRKQRGRS
jgi:predicted DNA-binding transcriptional regulator AlpA